MDLGSEPFHFGVHTTQVGGAGNSCIRSVSGLLQWRCLGDAGFLEWSIRDFVHIRNQAETSRGVVRFFESQQVEVLEFSRSVRRYRLAKRSSELYSSIERDYLTISADPKTVNPTERVKQ